MHKAESNGADGPNEKRRRRAPLLRRYESILFDPMSTPMVTNKSPGPGEDILRPVRTICIVGCHATDLTGFKERLSSEFQVGQRRMVRQGRPVCGPAGIRRRGPPGMYAKQIKAVVGHLGGGHPFATPDMASALWCRSSTTAPAIRSISVTIMSRGSRTAIRQWIRSTVLLRCM